MGIWLATVMIAMVCAVVLTISGTALAAAPVGSMPRAATARGDRAIDEKPTIALFEHTRDPAVFFSTTSVVQDIL